MILPDPDGELDLTPALVRRLCDRRAGIGADGVLRVVEIEVLAAALTESGPGAFRAAGEADDCWRPPPPPPWPARRRPRRPPAD